MCAVCIVNNHSLVFEMARSSFQHSIMPRSDTNVEILDCLDEILAPVDVNTFIDTDSPLLMKLWKDDPNIQDDIEKRVNI